MSKSVEIIVSEAQQSDAVSLQSLLVDVTAESDFILKDLTSSQMTSSDLITFIQRQEKSLNSICLLARLEEKVIGVLNVMSSLDEALEHVGDVFIAVHEDYRGYGIGQLLCEAMIDWAENNQIIRRLELTVQVKNNVALHIYQKYGFEIEGLQKRAVKTSDGEFRDVYAMARLIN